MQLAAAGFSLESVKAVLEQSDRQVMKQSSEL
jgi:hypothetical protein